VLFTQQLAGAVEAVVKHVVPEVMKTFVLVYKGSSDFKLNKQYIPVPQLIIAVYDYWQKSDSIW